MVVRQTYFSPILGRGELRDGWMRAFAEPQPCSGTCSLPSPPALVVLVVSQGSGSQSHTQLPPGPRWPAGSPRSPSWCPGFSKWEGHCGIHVAAASSFSASSWTQGQASAEGWCPFIREKQTQPSPLPTTASWPRCVSAAAVFPPQKWGTLGEV